MERSIDAYQASRWVHLASHEVREVAVGEMLAAWLQSNRLLSGVPRSIIRTGGQANVKV